jgi:hypothetical protein
MTVIRTTVIITHIAKDWIILCLPCTPTACNRHISYWLNELDSLGVGSKRNSELNDNEEVAALADNIKQVYYQDYKTVYSKEEASELDDDPRLTISSTSPLPAPAMERDFVPLARQISAQ